MIVNLSRISSGKIGYLSLLGLFLLSAQIQASVSFTISAERLQDPAGIDMAQSGVLVLVADTSGDGFQGPSSTSFVTADDFQVGMWDIATGGGNTPGAFQGTTGSVSLSGDWGEEDPLAIYWFPTLSLPIDAPGEAVPYGMYTNGTQDGTDPWTTPEDGTSGHKLIFLTTDAENLQPDGGSSDSADGLASNVTSGTGPADPSGLSAESSPGMIVLTWTDASDDETGFRIERSVEGSDVWELVGTVGPGITMFVDTTVETDTEYVYRIRAVRDVSWSGASASVQVETAPNRARIRNLSNRAVVGTGHERLIGSATAVGEPGTQVEVLVLVRGPSLALPSDYTGNVLADPKITLVNLETGEQITNDDFADWNNGEIETRFAGFITDPKESGVIFTMVAGEKGYSAIVEGADGGTGMANIEFYELGGTGSIMEARLRNLSNRAIVGTGHERLIGSATAIGEPGTEVEVLVLVRGPSLVLPSDYTGNVLADPKITLVNLETGEQITNDDFADWNNGEIETRFAGFITDPKESGAIFTMVAGEKGYSAIVEGADGGTGMANIEFYELLPGQ